MINKVFNYLIHSKYLFFIIVILFQLIIQIYFYNRTITQIGINEHQLLGFTTERHYENVAFNFYKYDQFASGDYPDLTPESYRAPLWPFILSIAYNFFDFDMKLGLIINNILLFLCSFLTPSNFEGKSKKV